MPKETFVPNPRTKPEGYSPATKAANLIFISGQVGVAVDGNLVGEGDCGAQAAQTFKNVEAALRAAGATLDDLTKITTYLVNVDDYPSYSAERLRLFPENGPASATVVVKELVKPEFLIEIEAIAAV